MKFKYTALAVLLATVMACSEQKNDQHLLLGGWSKAPKGEMEIETDTVSLSFKGRSKLLDRLHSSNQIVVRMIRESENGGQSYTFDISCDYEVSPDQLITTDCKLEATPTMEKDALQLITQGMKQSFEGVWARKYQ